MVDVGVILIHVGGGRLMLISRFVVGGQESLHLFEREEWFAALCVAPVVPPAAGPVVPGVPSLLAVVTVIVEPAALEVVLGVFRLADESRVVWQ
jgi:hypothetical protein